MLLWDSGQDLETLPSTYISRSDKVAVRQCQDGTLEGARESWAPQQAKRQKDTDLGLLK